jgi:LysR family transcriptional regulator, glycine cleavage system transcriptional activator
MSFFPSTTALRCFDASARLGSFTKAATQVHLSQGAVSQQILALESALDTLLFIRLAQGIKLTPAGQVYWQEVSIALKQIERATQNIITTKGHGGSLNVCVASSLATYWLMPKLGQFVAMHPQITLNLSTKIGATDFANPANVGVDAAIEFCNGAKFNLHAKRVMPLLLRPYIASAAVRKTANLPPTEIIDLLNTHPLIRHSTVAGAWARWLQKAQLSQPDLDILNKGPQYDLLSMALNAVIAGLGIALLPDYLVGHAVAAKQIKPISKVYWQADDAYYLRYPAWKAEFPALQTFEKWLALQSA